MLLLDSFPHNGGKEEDRKIKRKEPKKGIKENKGQHLLREGGPTAMI